MSLHLAVRTINRKTLQAVLNCLKVEPQKILDKEILRFQLEANKRISRSESASHGAHADGGETTTALQSQIPKPRSQTKS